jgi:hypothetical protein
MSKQERALVSARRYLRHNNRVATREIREVKAALDRIYELLVLRGHGCDVLATKVVKLEKAKRRTK